VGNSFVFLWDFKKIVDFGRSFVAISAHFFVLFAVLGKLRTAAVKLSGVGRHVF
jgi:hypothetical protein